MSADTKSEFIGVPRCEEVHYYCPGGFHPVHLNDTFKDGRYEVVHKLGYGAYGTVWLVYDTIFKNYASLKILAAEVSESHPEVLVLRHLQQHGTDIGKDYVVEVLDFFEHSGPNGVHQCIVMEVLGPSVSEDIEIVYPDEIFPVDVAKRMSVQLAHGLAYIHKAGVVHGDLHMGNILLHSPTITSWSSQSDVEIYLGVPLKIQLRLWETNEVAPPSPHMSEAFISTMQPNPLPRNIPVNYASPEIIFGDPTGLPADIWALAVLIHRLISGRPLFPSYYGIRKEVIRAMVWTLGKLPERWWCKWEERDEFFNEDAEWVGNKDEEYSFFDQLVVVEPWMDKAEIPAFGEFIRKMVRYDPGGRPSIDEVVDWMDQSGWAC